MGTWRTGEEYCHPPRIKEYKKSNECLGACRPCQGEVMLLLHEESEGGEQLKGRALPIMPFGDNKAEQRLKYPYSMVFGLP